MRIRAASARPAAVAVPARSTLLLAGVAVLALALRAPLLAGGQVDYDEGVYWESLRALSAHHPLFTSVYSSQPPGFLLLLMPGHLALGSTIAGERLTVLVLAMAGIGAVYRTASLLAGGPAAGVAAAAVLAADPLFLRQSVTLQADGPCVALALVALALAADARRREPGRARDLLAGAAGAVLATAVLTKPLSLAAGPPVAVLLVTGRARTDVRALAAAAAGGLAATAALLLPFAGAWPELWRQVVGLHLGARSLPVGGLDDATRWRELPVALLGLAGLAAAARRAPALALAGAAWAIPAVLLLAWQHPLWPHHVVAATAPLALLAGGLATLRRPWPAPPRWAAAGAALLALAVLAASAASARAVAGVQRPESDAGSLAAALRAATGPGDLVVTDDQFAAAQAGRDTPPELVDTSFVRVTSGDLPPGQAIALAARPDVRAVLLTTGRLAALPGFETWAAGSFPHARDLGGGRTLYWR
jgi:hypothetical protein